MKTLTEQLKLSQADKLPSSAKASMLQAFYLCVPVGPFAIINVLLILIKSSDEGAVSGGDLDEGVVRDEAERSRHAELSAEGDKKLPGPELGRGPGGPQGSWAPRQ